MNIDKHTSEVRIDGMETKLFYERSNMCKISVRTDKSFKEEVIYNNSLIYCQISLKKLVKETYRDIGQNSDTK